MNSQKQENLLSLAMESTREEREKSGILSVGVNEDEKRWEVIIKYHGNIERIANEEIQVELLIAGYAIVTLPAFVDKVMSLLFNMLSWSVIPFLPRNKHLLISWLQSPSAVILEPKK